MKQLFSILLLGILAFNIFGYRIYFSIAENNSTIAADDIIQKSAYDEQDLTTYKFSAKQLPYYSNSNKFEVVKGDVEVDGVIMTYVKKRIYKDSIEYVCLPNTQKTEIRNARDEFFKLVNDLNSLSQNKSTKKHNQSLIKPFSFEAVAFNESKFEFDILSNVKKVYVDFSNSNVKNPILDCTTPPPDFS